MCFSSLSSNGSSVPSGCNTMYDAFCVVVEVVVIVVVFCQ